MTTLEIINAIIVIVGLPTLLGAFIVIGRKFQKLDSIEDDIKEIKIDIKEIRNNLVDHESRVCVLEAFSKSSQINAYGVSNSPIRLKDEFRQYITDSGIAEQVEKHKPEIIKVIKKHPFSSEVELQQVIAAISSLLRKHKILDFSKMDKMVYENGLSPTAPDAIITIYLWETLIPEILPGEHPEIK